MKIARGTRYGIILVVLIALFLVNPRWVSARLGDVVFGAPIRFFVSHPDRIAVTAGVLFLLATLVSFLQRHIAWPLVAAGCAWILFAVWERYCMIQRYDIRVDLLVIWPGLLIFTIGALLLGFFSHAKSRGGSLDAA